VARIPAGQGPQEITVGAVPDVVLRRAGFTLPAGRSTPAASRCAGVGRRNAHHHRRRRRLRQR
jgi:hypothetical protein